MTTTLKRGIVNSMKRVKGWQNDLADLGYYKGAIDGDYGPKTEQATRDFQRACVLPPTGEADMATISAMEKVLGSSKEPKVSQGEAAAKVPQGPIDYLPNSERDKIFGTFNFSPQPGKGAPGCDIKVLTDPVTGKNWRTDNLTQVEVPQLRSIPFYVEGGKLGSGLVAFHRMAAQQLQGLFAAWEKAGLLKHVLTYEGAYVARYVRGSTKTLSNHAFGTAFDINAAWNGLNKTPARRGAKGSVHELVPLAEAYGFYWGGYGWNRGRPDGMHLEIAKVVGVTPGFRLP